MQWNEKLDLCFFSVETAITLLLWKEILSHFPLASVLPHKIDPVDGRFPRWMQKNQKQKNQRGRNRFGVCSVVEFGTPDTFAFADLAKQH